MLDTARNFFSVKSICRVLQQMGAHKMNKFDWHISDDQSFPLNVGPITNIFSVKASSDPAFAGMTGAFHPSKSYSMGDVKRIIGTARNYGIFVEPSIDSPGHCSSLMYGSKEVCQRVLGKPMQIIANWELVWGGSLNAPEPVLGYLDVMDDEKCTDVIKVMHSIFQEVYDAFGMRSGRYGRHFNIAADEVSEQIIPAKEYSAYLNKLLNIFSEPHWSRVHVVMWIDPVLALNVSKGENGYEYSESKGNGLELKKFDGRLTLGLWNLWPAVSVEQNNCVMDALSNSECINFNSNYMYMDAGAPQCNWSGYNYDITDTGALTTSYNFYWISALPTIGFQWGGYRGWPIPFSKIYTYNFHWDFTAEPNTGPAAGDPITAPSGITTMFTGAGTGQLHGVGGVGLAVWTETITEGMLDTKLVSNMAAAAELTWKYDESHASDNVNHATYRLHHHLQQLEQAPYYVTAATPAYSGANLERAFPQGCRMVQPVPNRHQLITQEFLDRYYPKWKITIRTGEKDDYAQHSPPCNDLLANINPQGPLGAKALALQPLSSRYAFGAMDADAQPDPTSRVNPWLMEDIGTLLKNKWFPTHIARSNFSSKSELFNSSPFYTDQRDACIELQVINNGLPGQQLSIMGQAYELI